MRHREVVEVGQLSPTSLDPLLACREMLIAASLYCGAHVQAQAREEQALVFHGQLEATDVGQEGQDA